MTSSSPRADGAGANPNPAYPPAETTGRSVVVFADDGEAGALAALRSAGVEDVASAGDFDAHAIDAALVRDADAVFFPLLGAAVVAGDAARLDALRSADRVLTVEPELVHHALPATGERDLATAGVRAFEDSAQSTWGLQATGGAASPWSGRGVRIAVLDTGLDLDHPDLAGRQVTSRSFVAGEPVQDGHGHGTHCVGTSCGLRAPAGGPRYGVAFEAEIVAGKVLSDRGRGSDAGILAGIEWALAEGCRIVSLSLGAPIPRVSPVYERVGQRALSAGTLIIAAAGNYAHRDDGDPAFVGVPANSPSIMAVAAVDRHLAVADFSAASNPVEGGQIDIAGPGVDVFSTWPMPQRYTRLNGTSMATPHVSGIAALYCQATGNTAAELWATLTRHATRLPLLAADVGAGLVRAPDRIG